MKRFEITAPDINAVIDKRIGFQPDDASYVQIHNDWRERLISSLELLNGILDNKYNKPREKGKNKQSMNAWSAAMAKKDKTFEIMESWYRANGKLRVYSTSVPLTVIAKVTGLNINTVRRFLEAQRIKLKMPDKTSLSKSVIEILKSTFPLVYEEIMLDPKKELAKAK